MLQKEAFVFHQISLNWDTGHFGNQRFEPFGISKSNKTVQQSNGGWKGDIAYFRGLKNLANLKKTQIGRMQCP
jgi:hypothetical protein